MTAYLDSTHGPVYSPTTTEKWLRCPAFRVYDQQLHARDNDWSPAMLLGSAIGEGLAHYYGTSDHFDDARDAALTALERGYVSNDEWPIDQLAKLTERGLKKALTLDVLEGGLGQVVGTEVWLGEECRADLIVRFPDQIVVTDWKVKFREEKQWEQKSLREFDNSWQLLHYAWRAQEKYGRPVTTQIGYITLQPTVRAVLHAVPTPPERIANWLASAQTVWAQMYREERGEAVPFMRHNDACWKYGQCAYYALCHTFGGDVEAAAMFYEPRQEYEVRLQGRRAA